MVEKVKLTREQNEAIQDALRVWTKRDLLDEHIVKLTVSNVKWGINNPNYQHLNDLSIPALATVLFVPDGYEVEEGYMIGDKIVKRDGGKFVNNAKVVTVASVEKDSKFPKLWIRETGSYALIKHVRHATPEEIAWADSGREPLDFREDDIIINRFGMPVVIYDGNIDDIKQRYGTLELKGFVPAERIIKFGGVK